MNQKIKKRIFEIIEISGINDLPSKIFDCFIITLIFLNVIAIILESERSLSLQYNSFFEIFEIFSVAVFTIEYILRLWVCIFKDEFKNNIKGRIRYAFTPMALIDLFAILPFYLPMIIPFDLRFIRMFRLLRIFRMFKFGRYFEAFKILGNVFKEKKEELLITIFIMLTLLVISSSLVYYFENEKQPEIFSSILTSMYWGIATLTTVGYGDVYPLTPIGKLLTSFVAILGIGFFALPTGIIGSGFVEQIQKMKEKDLICPHCKKIIKEGDLK